MGHRDASNRREGVESMRCSLLLKSDHPRAIDRYIDYFGGSPGARLEDRAAPGSANDEVALETPWVEAPWLAGGADRSGLRDVL